MKIKLWTIQTEEAVTVLQSKGILRVGKEFIRPEDEEAYNWMKGQMTQRIGLPQHVGQYPIWAWYQKENSNKRKPDLRGVGYLPKGTVGYRIEFEKEKREVLLSDFELWHMPFAYKSFIADSEEGALQFEAEMLRKYGSYYYEKLPNEMQSKVRDSWEKIFDMNFEEPYYTQSFKEKSIQATFWELRTDEIIKVDRFIAR